MKNWISIIIGVLITFSGIFVFADIWNDGYVLVGFIFTSGFVATYLSDTKKSRNGLYPGLIILLGSVIVDTLITKTSALLTGSTLILLIIIFLVPGFMGGFLAKYWFLYQKQKDLIQENVNNLQNQTHKTFNNKIKDYFKYSENIILLIGAFLFSISLFAHFYWRLNILSIVLAIPMLIMGLYVLLKG
ncbi:hypothetical protein [Methanobacterium formicicum]|uniref:Uncharacterized protein n=1 Tax=Methanobacterium formicicum (strain DSM 3637 / PP1) TaxID=1204725 RepID=K2REW2_METFP|nr:hypothetical protein [Methanobacterium formicicum]EKF86924.1 hypothetical protein A994_01520 [Methanobacterium formicicum DSM 3637]